MLIGAARQINSFHQLTLPKILVLEDDQAIADLIKEWFSMCGYICHTEQNTSDMIGLMITHQPDLVIIDYLLPGINGGELCSQVKRNPQTAHIPVVICSAYSRVLLSLGDYGCDAFIAKPFDLNELTETVAQLLENNYHKAAI
jgi:CheY-like chemotaxis protein